MNSRTVSNPVEGHVSAHACWMIWDAAGRPDPTEPPSGEGRCAHCRQVGPVSMRLGPNFTDYRLLADVTGRDLCPACSWCLGGKPPRTLRMWTTMVRLDRPVEAVSRSRVSDRANWEQIYQIGLSPVVSQPELEHPHFAAMDAEVLEWSAIHEGAWVSAADAPEGFAHWDQVKKSAEAWVRTADWDRVAAWLPNADELPEWQPKRMASAENVAALKSVKQPPTIETPPYASGPHLCLTNRKDMRPIAAILANPPRDGSPWLVAVAESGQKHTAPFAPVNHGTGPWTVRMDSTMITSNPDEWRAVISRVAALRAAGFSAVSIETGQPHFAALAGDGLAAWRAHAPHLAPWQAIDATQGAPLLHMANLMITKETNEHYLAAYPV